MDRYFHDEMPVPGSDPLVRNTVAAFYFRVRGDAMSASDIADGYLLVVDRSVDPKDGHIVVAFVAGERIVRRLQVRGDVIRLVTDEPRVPVFLENLDQYTAETLEPRIWGVVVGVFKKLQR